MLTISAKVGHSTRVAVPSPQQHLQVMEADAIGGAMGAHRREVGPGGHWMEVASWRPLERGGVVETP